MKKFLFKTTRFCMLVTACCSLFVSCDLFDDGYGKCDDDAPYWCKSAKACCAYPYHDGHGTCWETMEGCRSSGYPCTTCHIQD